MRCIQEAHRIALMVANPEGTSPAAAELQRAPAAATVLVIEDDAAFRSLLALHLSRAGYKVLAAEDAAVGGAMLLASRPDMLVLDILLPYLGGLDFLEAMRHDPDVGRTPVICLTGMRDDANYIRAMELGAEAVLAKPLRVEELLAALARVMKRAGKHAGPEGAK